MLLICFRLFYLFCLEPCLLYIPNTTPPLSKPDIDPPLEVRSWDQAVEWYRVGCQENPDWQWTNLLQGAGAS